MRPILVSACALLLLSGCGRNSSDTPQAAGKSSQGGAEPQAKKQPPPAGNQGTDPGPGAKQGSPPVAAGPGFDADDPQKTLNWLIRSAAKLRATPPADQAAVDRAWADYAQAVKAADGRKIRWELMADTVTPEGVVTQPVKSPLDPACRGLRLKPDRQPAEV